jgi:uncharacterized protein YpuA (DUF1002 family)
MRNQEIILENYNSVCLYADEPTITSYFHKDLPIYIELSEDGIIKRLDVCDGTIQTSGMVMTQELLTQIEPLVERIMEKEKKLVDSLSETFNQVEKEGEPMSDEFEDVFYGSTSNYNFDIFSTNSEIKLYITNLKTRENIAFKEDFSGYDVEKIYYKLEKAVMDTFKTISKLEHEVANKVQDLFA